MNLQVNNSMSVIETDFEQILNASTVRIFRSTIARVAGGNYTFNESQNGAGLILEGTIASDQSSKLPYLRLILNTIGDMSVARFEAIGNISHYIIDELMLKAFEDYKVMEIELTELDTGRIKIQLNRKKLPSKRLYAVFKKQFFSYYANEPAHLLVLFDQEQDPTTTIAVAANPRAIRPKVSGFMPRPELHKEPKSAVIKPLANVSSVSRELTRSKTSFQDSQTLMKTPVTSDSSSSTTDNKSVNANRVQELSQKVPHEGSIPSTDARSNLLLKSSLSSSIPNSQTPSKSSSLDNSSKSLLKEQSANSVPTGSEAGKLDTSILVKNQQHSDILVTSLPNQKGSDLESLNTSLSSYTSEVSYPSDYTSMPDTKISREYSKESGPISMEETTSQIISPDEVSSRPKPTLTKEKEQEISVVSGSLSPIEERVLRVIESKPKQKVQSKGLKKDLLVLDQLIIKQTLRSLVRKGYLYVDAAWYIRKDPNEIIELASSKSLDERVKNLSPKEKKVFDILYNREGRKAQARMLMKGTKMSKENLKKILRDLVAKDVLYVQAAWYIIKG